jgi:septal ring factor EnvC (AmiA/AmiB activator)
MSTAASELRETLMTLQSRQESVNAVAAIKENIEAFHQSAQILNDNLARFDQSVEHTFEAIDRELAESVMRLSKMGETIARLHTKLSENDRPTHEE